MIKKLFLAIVALAASMNMAFAQVDVNKADAAALDSVKGVGPAMSKAIIDERAKGEFKDWADFQKRVKGVGDKRAAKLSEAGLQVNGKSKEGAPMAAASGAAKGKMDEKAAKPAKADEKAAKPAKAAKSDAHPKATS
jgi:competence protein ComEA